MNVELGRAIMTLLRLSSGNIGVMQSYQHYFRKITMSDGKKFKTEGSSRKQGGR